MLNRFAFQSGGAIVLFTGIPTARKISAPGPLQTCDSAWLRSTHRGKAEVLCLVCAFPLMDTNGTNDARRSPRRCDAGAASLGQATPNHVGSVRSRCFIAKEEGNAGDSYGVLSGSIVALLAALMPPALRSIISLFAWKCPQRPASKLLPFREAALSLLDRSSLGRSANSRPRIARPRTPFQDNPRTLSVLTRRGR